jgi:hypothetical protein
MTMHDGILGPLGAARARLRRLLVLERCMLALAFGLAAMLAAVALDRVFRLPPWIRLAEDAALVAGGAAWLRWRVVPALRFRPPLVEVALRVERAEGVRGVAIAVDLAAARADGASGALTEDAIRQGLAAMPRSIRVDAGPARRASGWALGALAVAVLLAWLAPDLASIGLRRLTTPFADVSWPARTMVEADMGGAVRARGPALALRARHVRGDESSMRVEAEYRVERDGAFGTWRRVVLPLQPGGAFERLVEADGDRVEVVFRTEDMETASTMVRLVPPPSVRSASLVVDPPGYAREAVDRRTADLGPGTDRRATVSPPVLAGSRVSITLEVEGASGPPAAEDPGAWIASTFALADADGSPRTVEFAPDASDPARWTVGWVAAGRGVLEVRLVGEGGVEPADRIAFEVPAIEDAAPSVAIVEPVADEAVTPDASPMVRAEARDDLGIMELAIDASLQRAGGESIAQPSVTGSGGQAATAERTLDLRAMGANPGDRVTCVARARDAFESGGARREPVTSAPRVFRVIAPSELADQVRSRLGQMREAAERLRNEQAELRARAEALAERAQGRGRAPGEAQDGARAASGPPSAEDESQLAAAEGRMSERIGAFERSLDELAGRLERNRTDGDGLKATIDDARDDARRAAQRAQDATRSLEPGEAASRADAGSRPGEPGTDDQAERMQQAAQQAAEAEQALADLESALQRDRETAELARRVDKLSERVDAARRESREATDRAIGRSREQLGEDARAELDRAAQAQREAAAEARDLVEDLERRAQEVEREERPEPGLAEALREAAREADERGLARQLEQAAQQTQQNQGQASQQSQQSAQEAVQAMQQAMRSQRRARAEELRRRMTEVTEAMRALLARVEERVLPVQQLDAADADSVDREARALLDLSRRAAGVAEQAAQSGSEFRRSAGLVMQGSGQLDESATSLRAVPVDGAASQASLGSARTSIQDALEAAQRARQEAERAAENQRRAELREVYTAILERQRSVRTGTEATLPAPGSPADRRTLLESRRLGTEQSAVTGLLKNAAARQDLAASELFLASTQEMVGASGAAGQDLWSGTPSRRTLLLQGEVEAGIAALIEALADPPEPEDRFADEPQQGADAGGAGGGEGMQGGQPRVPPIAELRLLRTMAQRVLDDTAAAESLGAAERDAYLGRVAERQRKITELGERWVKSMRPPAPSVEPAAPADGGEP